MPRQSLAVRPSPRVSLVPQLKALYRGLRAGEKAALANAKKMGDLLAPLPPRERDEAAVAVGFSPRWGRAYVQIAEGWPLVLAARCQSIRCALKATKGDRKAAPKDPIREQVFDHPPGPAEVAVYFAGWENRPVRVTAEVVHYAPGKPRKKDEELRLPVPEDEQQPRLPFD